MTGPGKRVTTCSQICCELPLGSISEIYCVPMAHIKIVHTDLRVLLMNKTPQQPEMEPQASALKRSVMSPPSGTPLSFSELQILLERAKPHAVNKFQVKGKPDPSRIAQRVSLQNQYHFERLNIAKSVQAISANDSVQLSARSMVS